MMSTEKSNGVRKAGLGRSYYVLCILTLAYSFNFIDRQLLAILQESVKADLGLNDSQLGLLTGFAFAVFYVTAGIPIARLADRANRKNIIAASIFIWSFMTAVSGLAQNYIHLLLARIGVGIGEAGGSPPSHSIISDLFPKDQRAGALGFYSMGISIGILFGFLFGGWLNEFFGWRTAFMVVGLPGILLAAVVATTIREPKRGESEIAPVTDDEQPSIVSVLATLWSRKAFRHLALGASLNAFCGYGISNWTASFMIRTHEMSTGELGTWLALIIGIGGAFGVLCGGVLCDRLGSKDDRWYAIVPCLAGLISVPFIAAVYLMPGAYLAFSMMIIPAVLSNVYLGSTIATTHRLVSLKMRATSSAILFFIINMIGLGGGPFVIGFVSDMLSATMGGASLRYAMLYVLPPVMIWSAFHFFLASRKLTQDLRIASPVESPTP